jgi:hypothetical protein
MIDGEAAVPNVYLSSANRRVRHRASLTSFPSLAELIASYHPLSPIAIDAANHNAYSDGLSKPIAIGISLSAEFPI